MTCVLQQRVCRWQHIKNRNSSKSARRWQCLRASALCEGDTHSRGKPCVQWMNKCLKACYPVFFVLPCSQTCVRCLAVQGVVSYSLGCGTMTHHKYGKYKLSRGQQGIYIRPDEIPGLQPHKLTTFIICCWYCPCTLIFSRKRDIILRASSPDCYGTAQRPSRCKISALANILRRTRSLQW